MAAPSGGAAFNVGGETIHSLLEVAVHRPWQNISESKQNILKQKLRHLLVLIIDERSQLSSKVIASAEEHVKNCAFNGHNKNSYFAGIPVVLVIGDDYQLPPVKDEGAINGYAKYHTYESHVKDCNNHPQEQLLKNGEQHY